MHEPLRKADVRYALLVDDVEPAWETRGAHIEESLSATYGVDARILADEDVSPEALLGRTAELVLDHAGKARRFPGFVRAVEETDGHGHGTPMTVRVVPAFALLDDVVDSRIFQDLTVVEIVRDVLELPLAHYGRELDVSGLDESAFLKREMTVQYRESVRAFVERLLEEEGIAYDFAIEADEPEKLTLFVPPRPRTQPLLPEALEFRSQGAHLAPAGSVLSFAGARSTTSTSVLRRDHDWTAPTFRVEGEAGGASEHGFTRRVYEHGLGQAVTLSDFQPGGRYQQHDARRLAQLSHDRRTSPAARFVGTSTAVGMEAGVEFELAGHPVLGMDGRYVVLEVEHGRAEGVEAYQNRFACIPVDHPWAPPRKAPKPRIAGVQTAIVSGPVPGEPFTDEYARVKVRFHWDLRADDPERTSAWVRVAQTWGGHDGAGRHTALFLPRVGTEVLVTFVDGDPDRPLVTGCVFNARNLPPLDLPREASRSVLRTESIGGDGFNELSFEDALGNEEVYLRAERDLRELVQRNQSTTVGNDRSLNVGHDRSVHVGHDEQQSVGGGRRHEVTADDELLVDGRRIVSVRGESTLTSVGRRTETFAQGIEERTAHGRRTFIQGGLVEEIGDGRRTEVDVRDVLSVAGEARIDARDQIHISSGESRVRLDPSDIQVVGTHSVQIDGPTSFLHLLEAQTRFHSGNEIQLRVGNCEVSITQRAISISAPTVEINGQNLVDIQGGIVSLNG